MKKTANYIFKSITSHVKSSLILVLIIAIFAFVIVAGNVINLSLSKGISNTEKRLGADILLVPDGSRDDAENIILTGQRGYFYFSNSIYQNVSEIDGIKEITAQCFLKSLSADCCSTEVQIVFYDPSTDFIVEPWISTVYSDKLNKGEVILGSDVESENGVISLFGNQYKVVAQMSKTGTSIDTSVYFTFEEKVDIINAASAKGGFLTDEQKAEDVISSIYINVKEGVDIDTIIDQCHHVAGEDFDVIYPKSMSDSLSGNLNFFLNTISTVMIIGEIIITLIFVFTNHFFISRRKQEVAILRVFGNSKKYISKVLLLQVNSIGFVGGLIGIFLGWLIVIPFGNYIGYSLGMPYLGPDFKEIVIGTVIAILIVLIVTTISSLFTIVYVCNLESYEALRQEAE